jgi:DNA repair exonuclease SbcCD ATPase subunit
MMQDKLDLHLVFPPDPPNEAVLLALKEQELKVQAAKIKRQNTIQSLLKLEAVETQLESYRIKQASYEQDLATYHTNLQRKGDSTLWEMADELERTRTCPICQQPVKLVAELVEDLKHRATPTENLTFPTDHSGTIKSLEDALKAKQDLTTKEASMLIAVKVEENKLKSLQKEAEEQKAIKAKHEDWKTQAAILKSHVANITGVVQRLEDKLAKVENVDAEIAKYDRRASNLTDIRYAIREIPSLLRNGVSEYLERGLSAHLKNSPCIDVKTVKVEGFQPVVNDLTLNLLSGAQQAAVAIIMRVLLCQLIGSSLFIMDEPTNNMDKETRRWLIEFIDKLDFEQVIIVTHDELLDGDNIIRL